MPTQRYKRVARTIGGINSVTVTIIILASNNTIGGEYGTTKINDEKLWRCAINTIVIRNDASKRQDVLRY